MTNPNPFVPKGSLLEQQSRRRSGLKLGVFCVLAVSVTGLVAMLIQGCKRETPSETGNPEIATNPPAFTDVTNPPTGDTNPVAYTAPLTNPAANPLPPVGGPATAPVTSLVPPPVTSVPAPVESTLPGSSYEVVKGDTLATIAKAHHITLKELQAANPGVDSKHLKIKQKLTIPAGSASAVSAPATALAADATGASETYTVKSGDSLTKISKKYGVSIKALKAANPKLDVNHIKVGAKLVIPAKAAPVAPAPAPVVEPIPTSAPAPMPLPSVPAPATTPAPAPGH
ncbi:MAG TPA: LysM peptidoglycan-binding domain-containing protein, partial [Verrucomicrobiae bacterium]